MFAFPEEKLAHSTEKWSVGLKTNMGLMGFYFLTSNGACCGYKALWPCCRFLGLTSFIWLGVDMCLSWSEAVGALHLESELYLRCFIHSFPGLSCLTVLQDATCKLEQVTNTSGSDCILRNSMALCWAAFTAVPGHLCVSVISSSNRTKCVRGFNKLMLVKCRPAVCVSEMLFLQQKPVSALAGALG